MITEDERESSAFRLGELQVHAARLVAALDRSRVKLDASGRFALDQVRRLTEDVTR